MTMRENLYPKDWFVDSVPDSLTCPICLGVLFEPAEIKQCEHLFCQSCITAWINEKQSLSCCPVDRDGISFESLKKPSRNLLSILADLKLKCPETGCEEIVTYSDIQVHRKTCVTRKTLCLNGCNQFLLNNEKPRHNCLQYTVAIIEELRGELHFQKENLNELRQENQRLALEVEVVRTERENLEVLLREKDTVITKQKDKIMILTTQLMSLNDHFQWVTRKWENIKAVVIDQINSFPLEAERESGMTKMVFTWTKMNGFEGVEEVMRINEYLWNVGFSANSAGLSLRITCDGPNFCAVKLDYQVRVSTTRFSFLIRQIGEYFDAASRTKYCPVFPSQTNLEEMISEEKRIDFELGFLNATSVTAVVEPEVENTSEVNNISATFLNVSYMQPGDIVYSEPRTFFGFTWKIKIVRSDKFLLVALSAHKDCEEEVEWNLTVRRTIEIENATAEKSIVRKGTANHDRHLPSWGDEFVTWEDLLKPVNGWLQLDIMHVQASFKIM